MMDMSALSGSGMQVDLYGNDLEDLRTAGKQVAALMESVDGIENVSDGCLLYTSGWAPVGVHQINVTLAPGESRSLIFLLGYIENPEEEKWAAPGVINKTREMCIRDSFQATAEIFKEAVINRCCQRPELEYKERDKERR